MVPARVCAAGLDCRIDEARVLVGRGNPPLVGRQAIRAEHLRGCNRGVDLRCWILVIFKAAKRTFSRFWRLESWALGRLGVRLDLRRALNRE